MMSYGLARHKSSLFAAFGSVSGTMLDCGEQPSHPMPVIVMHGTNDGTLPYDGNSYYTSIESTLDYWNAFNNTDASPRITSASDVGEKGSFIEMERYEYGQGDKDSSVEHYKMIGGGHDWFNLSFNGQQTNTILLNFFSHYDLSALR
jgi:polyhydroxybutyrate depolymerase